MLDRYSLDLLKPYLERGADFLARRGWGADRVTILAFGVGLLGAALIGGGHHLWGLALILLNRLGDGIDGALARKTGPTDRGAFLDISLDFIFYAAVILGFAAADPAANGLAAAFLIFSFVGTGATFLAFAIIAERRSLANLRLPSKGFYYLGGLAEGTETVLFFVLICLFPPLFPALAWIFGTICLISAALRLIYGYTTLG